MRVRDQIPGLGTVTIHVDPKAKKFGMVVFGIHDANNGHSVLELNPETKEIVDIALFCQ